MRVPSATQGCIEGPVAPVPRFALCSLHRGLGLARLYRGTSVGIPPTRSAAPSRNVEFVLPGSLRGPRCGYSVALDLLLLLIASAPAFVPLAAPGYLQGPDAVDPPWRALLLREAVQDGVFFPRWAPDAFYRFGYPVFNFYSPLSLYPVLLFSLVPGTDLVDATKVAFGANLLLAGVGSYLLARGVVRHRVPSLLAGVLYMYAPFTLGEVYLRSSLAGSAGLALLPFALAAFVRLCRKPSLPLGAAGALLVALVILTHNITGVVALGMIAALIAGHFWTNRDRGALVLSGLALALGVGAASFYWIPATAEVGLTHTESLFTGIRDFRRHFVDPLGDVDGTLYEHAYDTSYRLTSWGPIDLHPAYPYGPPPYKLSLFQGLLFLLSGLALLVGRKRPFPVGLLFLLAAGLFFLHTSWSRSVWEVIPPFIQFPWRLTGPLALCLAVVSSWALLPLCRRARALPLFLVGAAAALSSLWMLPTGLAPFEGGTEITRESLTQYEYREPNRFGTHPAAQFLPLSVQWDVVAMGQKDLIRRYNQSFPPDRWVAETALVPYESRARIVAVRKGQRWMQALVEAGDRAKIAFHTVYFAGWTAYVDGQETPIEPTSWVKYEEGRRAALGIAEVTVPEGSHLVTLVFEDTPVRRWSGLLGVAGVVGIGVVLVAGSWRRPGARTRKAIPAALILSVVAGGALGYLAYGGLSARPAPAWEMNRILLDLVNEAKRGELRIDVPEGARPEDYVHLKSYTIQEDTRPVLYMHPPASASIRVWLPRGARLEFAMAMDPEVWDKGGDGVEFRVEVREGGFESAVFSAYVDPKSDGSQRRWIESSVDLGPFGGREVELVLRTLPGDSGDFDWAGWATPRIAPPHHESMR